MALFQNSPDISLPPYAPPMVKTAASGTPIPLPSHEPSLNSEGFRVLGLGPPVVFECAISFTIYCSEKTRRNTTNWVPVRPISDLSVTFNSHNNLSWANFRNLIAEECNRDYNHLGKTIVEGTTSSPATMTWTAYILKNKKFPKMNPHPLFDDVSFNQWTQEICSSKQAKGGVIIQMDNPKNKIMRARKEDLLAKTMKRIEARQRGPSTSRSLKTMGDSDEVDSSDVEFDDLDIHVDQIYTKYGMNSDYNRIHPVYLDPTNPN
ncbi:hypothetical protein PTTG_27680 [Puccinia triticina 1-1 BBBD Race 1]|uniref:Uncharacterized protein n=1 Tax=Puccinia triticina (isolate 1-1 / race 1 (BBBD)) TaxID=630390 RepID=A0A180GI77_PUCT1|nr:hypothetical protein PTTG_27680 [Puccinia triticina 1-1 BBBD Race 1]